MKTFLCSLPEYDIGSLLLGLVSISPEESGYGALPLAAALGLLGARRRGQRRAGRPSREA